ncbi:MAG: heme-degrading domain-containing protein [Thiothrix sp.]|nr:MAG: heme-degrading domain-containing protein [Thiothrix sp.]
MNIEQDIAQIVRQEQRLQFTQFDAETAWTIGSRLREIAKERNLSVVIDIQVNDHQLFHVATNGVTPNNADWVRRKRNLVQHYHCSSYLMKLRLQHQKANLEDKTGLNSRDLVAAGGCFPINLKGTGCIGTITVSGLAQREDHNLVVKVLAEYLELPLAELALT